MPDVHFQPAFMTRIVQHIPHLFACKTSTGYCNYSSHHSSNLRKRKTADFTTNKLSTALIKTGNIMDYEWTTWRWRKPDERNVKSQYSRFLLNGSCSPIKPIPGEKSATSINLTGFRGNKSSRSGFFIKEVKLWVPRNKLVAFFAASMSNGGLLIMTKMM